MSMNIRSPLVSASLLVFATLTPATAHAIGGSFAVQTPELKAPQRGSVAGVYADLSIGAASVSRGSFSLPLPIDLPSERGACLVDFLPSYSPQGGLSAWGMGWGAALEIRREPIAGELNYDAPDFVSPWGRLRQGQDGKWYVPGLQSHVVVTVTQTGWRAVDPEGVTYDFAPGLKNGNKIYSWELVRATDVVGGVTELTYEEVNSQRTLKRVTYGSVAEPGAYVVDLTYEASTLTYVSYRSGRAENTNKRVKTVTVKRAGKERWRYDLAYKENGLSPAFYLISVQKKLAAGGSEPAITYSYKEADQTLAELAATPSSDATAYVQATQDVSAFSYDKASYVDVNRDGLLDFERPYDHAMMVRTGATWVAEPLGPRPDTGFWSYACRPIDSSDNGPRTLARLDGPDADVQVVRTIYQPAAAGPNGTITPAHTKVARCDRDGLLRAVQNIDGFWELSTLVRLTDVNHDALPDLLRVDAAGFEVVVNGGAGQGFGQHVSGPLHLANGAPLDFTPQRLWFEDVNGDGMGDIVVSSGNAFYAWYGKGQLQFVDKALAMPLYRNTGTQWVIDEIGDRAVTFMDVNNDGLQDVLLAGGSDVRLYAGWGHLFVYRDTQAFQFGFQEGWNMDQPVVADLDGDGDEELVYAGYHFGVGEVRSMRLSPAGTGLLTSVNDGKGSLVTFGYARGPAAENVGVRPVVLSSLRIRTVGLDAETAPSGAIQYGELAYDYDYLEPVLHHVSHAFLGYRATLRRGPHGVEVARFQHDDDVVDVLDASYMYPLSAPWAGDLPTRLYRYQRNAWTHTTYAGVPMVRLDSSSAGWGQHPRDSDDSNNDNSTFWTLPEPHEEVGVVNAFAYDGVCTKSILATSRRGTVLTETDFAAPSKLAGALHCLPASETVTGTHPEPSSGDNFVQTQALARNDAGQVTKVWQGSQTSMILVQSVTYDAFGRVKTLSTPGKTAEVTTSIDYTGGLPKSVTGPDGVRVEVTSFDQLTDRIRTMQTDRAGTTFQAYYEYDGFERLAKQWDSAGASSSATPLNLLAYAFPTDTRLGRVEGTQLVAAAAAGKPAIWRHAVSWHAGDGGEVANAALIPEGWAVSGLGLRSRTGSWQRDYVRSPIASTSVDLSYAQLLDGAQELSFSQSDGIGETMRTHAVLAQGVTQDVVVRFSWTTDGIRETTTENGTYVTVRQRDAEGNVMWVRDPGGYTTAFHHDAVDRLRTVTLPDGTTQTLTFDGFGRPQRVHRPDVGDVVYSYDPASGWLDHKDFIDAEGVTYRSVAYAYDAAGRITTTTATAPNTTAFTTTRYYDGRGPAGSAVLPGQTGFLSRVVGDSFSKETRYNGDGTIATSKIRLRDMIEVETSTAYFADKTPRQTTRIVRNLKSGVVIDQSVREVLQDAYGRVDRVRLNGNDLLAFDYDGEGRVHIVDFVTGESVEFTHDAVTRALNGYTSHTGDLWSSGVKWTLNARGFIAREDYTFASEPGAHAAYSGQSVSRRFQYTARGELERAADNDVESAYYEYDNKGLVTFTRDLSGSRTIGHPHDRHFVVEGVEYTYDAAGRLVQKGDVHYWYGAHGDIREVSSPDGLFRYYYDEQGERLLKTKVQSGVETLHAAYVGGEYITATQVIEPLALEDRVVGVFTNGSFQMLATDPRGSTLANVDGSLNLASPYGVRIERPDLSEALDYAEHGFDPQMQLVRMGARDYDPALGQFTRPDPMFAERIDACAASPVQCNLFGYAIGNPVSYVDPTGLGGEPKGAATPRDQAHYIEHVPGGTVQIFGPDEWIVDMVDAAKSGNTLQKSEGKGAPTNGSSAQGTSPTDVQGSAEGVRDGVTDGATYGEKNGTPTQALVDGFGWFGKFSEWVTSMLPRVTNSTKQAINGAMILMDMFSGVGGVGKLARMAMKEGKGFFKTAFRWIRCRNSFAAGTLVRTVAGLVPIEELEEGDLVWSRDEITGEEDWRPVVGTIAGGGEVRVLTVERDGRREELTVTPNHPFALVDGRWIDAGELAVGDELASADHTPLLVVAIRTEPRIPAFNFEVAEYHTYFVGEAGAWAHNCPLDALAKKEINIAAGQVQKKFKHAADFGVEGNYNPANAQKFTQAIEDHVNNPMVKEIVGSYHGNPVTHFLDPATGLNVIRDEVKNFLSGWKLSPKQLEHVSTSGKL